jgi:peptidoglycan hydrolase-like protein with peptidoglycan-binding domain
MQVLKKGDSGSATKLMQEFLDDEGFYKGLIDGSFGPKTEESVIKFQKQFNLKADGVVGSKTYAKFAELGFKKEGNEFKSSSSFSEDSLVEIIYKNSSKLINKGFDPEKHVIAVAIRGFNLDTGEKGKNDRRIYDDKHFIVTPKAVKSFTANTDPSGFKKGYGTGSNKGMACLKKGVWFFGKGTHKGSPSFRQCCPFTVIRDGNPPYEDTGYHAINWHSGGQTSTSSLGCQTNKPNDFIVLRDYIYQKMEEFNNPKMKNDWGQEVRAIPYILIEEVDRRKGILTV